MPSQPLSRRFALSFRWLGSIWREICLALAACVAVVLLAVIADAAHAANSGDSQQHSDCRYGDPELC